MKKIIVFVSAMFLFSSCKKEYQCSNGETYKYGSSQYNLIKSGKPVYDSQNNRMHCI